VTAVREVGPERPVPYEQLGRPIRGPEALTDDWRRVWDLTFNIAVMNWKLRFFGSILGYLWQLIRPLLLFLVLYVFFTKIARIGDGAGPGYAHYGVQLLASIVLMTFFQESTSTAVRSVVESEALVRKIQFPRIVIPLATVLLASFNLMLNLVVVLIFAFASGISPMLSWLELPFLILLLGVLATGLAMLWSSLFVWLRDLQPIWEVVLQVLFYASPIIVPVAKVASHVTPTELRIYMANPITAVLQQFRHAGVTHATRSVSDVLGGPGWLIPIGVTLAIFALGFVVFDRTAPAIAENV
jgi:ABC-2 type transport system permease protein